MKKRKRSVRWTILLVAITCVVLLIRQYHRRDPIPNVIIMTFSGLRNTESIDDPTHQYIPHLWTQMRREGVFYTRLTDLNHEFHMPSVWAINTGMTNPVFSTPLKSPSLFQYVRKKYKLPSYKTWSIGHWFDSDYAVATPQYPENTFPDALSLSTFSVSEPCNSPHLAKILNKPETSFLETFPEFMRNAYEKWPNWDSLGEVQYQMLLHIMHTYKPKLIHYVINDIEVAHSDSFAKYVLALRACDRRIYEIWRLIQNDPFYKGRTYLFVNVDHSRNRYYMDHYENAFYDNPSRVWLYVYGPGIRKDKIIDRTVHHTDVFATVAYLLHLKTHPTQGKILYEVFPDGTPPAP